MKKESLPIIPQEARRRLQYTLDSWGRRVLVETSDAASDTWKVRSTRRYLENQLEPLAELDDTGYNVRHFYTWGLDITGTRNGAGGIGGLLIGDLRLAQPNATNLIVFDGNGNVVGLIQAQNGTQGAEYEYDMLGNAVKISGLAAVANPFRFSTKWCEGETGDVHFWARDYRPWHGRWINRDPIGEVGGVNLYGFVGNDAANRQDKEGLYTLQDARNSLRIRGIAPEATKTYVTSGRGIVGPVPIEVYSDQQVFDEWYRLEKVRARKEWWRGLEECPPRLCVVRRSERWSNRSYAKNVFAKNPEKWQEPERPSNAELDLHPETIWSIRTKAGSSRHANQCTYDAEGLLLRTPPDHGTVDWYHPKYFPGHYRHDVEPVYLANRLDGGASMGVVSSTVIGGPAILRTPGINLKRYYEVIVNTMEQVFSLLATVISVGVLVSVMTSTGVRGLIAITFITLPLFFVYASVLIFGPLAQGSLSYGSAIIIGVPIIFLFNSMGINNTVVAAALSLVFPLGDCLPPSMIVGRVTLETVGYEGSYNSFLKGIVIPWLFMGVVALLMLIFANDLSFLVI